MSAAVAVAASPAPPPPVFEVETTPIGIQTLVAGVAPITPAQRLALRADAPLLPKKPQRSLDLGLFDTAARNQIEMF
jgi:hypothetical protein